MTDVIDDLFTIAGRRDNGTATIRSAVLRPSNERPGAVTPADHKFDIVNGQLRLLNLDPGPAKLFIRMGTWTMQWASVSIPDSDTPITLRTVLENYVEHEPGVVSEVRGHADRAEASAIRSESAADRAEESEQYVQGVVDNGVAMVRSEVQDNADAAIAASGAAADSALAAAGEREEAEQAASTAGGHRDAADAAAAAAGEFRDDAQAAATLAGQHKDAAAEAASDAHDDAQAAEASRQGAVTAAGTAATDAADQVTTTLQQAVAADRQAAETARGGAETAATTAAGHEDAAEGFAAAAGASAQAADAARQLAEEAAENAQQGAPSGGWLRAHLEQAVQDDLQRARTALQEMPVATPEAPGAIKIAGHLAGTASDPRIANGVIEFNHFTEEMGRAVYFAAILRGASYDENDIDEYVGLPIGLFREDIQVAVARAASAYIKPALGIPGDDLADGAVDLDQLSDVEPFPATPSVKAAVGFAAEILTTFDVNGGWTRDNLTQSVQDDLGKAATAMQGSKNGTPAALKVWVGTEAQYNAATNNGTSEAANTIYLRGA
ncbi:hypothetical protein GS941_20755 [Rhodococcus hoagii]|nr:hypothetical protein [Prescottella equi]